MPNNFISKITAQEKQWQDEIANIKNVNISLGLKDGQLSKSLPELMKIGNLQDRNNVVPALFPLDSIRGVAFELNDTNRHDTNLQLQYIALQLIQELNPKACEIIVVDPLNMGSSFRFLNNLDKSVCDELVFDESKIDSLIGKHFDRSIAVKQECNRYANLSEYNEQSGSVQPFRFVFIADFPHGFRTCIDKLDTIIHNGSDAGIFFFIGYDPKINIGTYQDKVDKIISKLVTVKNNPQNKDVYQIGNLPNSDLYNKSFSLHLDKNDLDIMKLEANFQKYYANNNPTSTDSNEGGVQIPIGTVGGLVHNFVFGHGMDAYNAIIGGQSGRGKTNLLNNIIAKGLEKYNSDELRFILLDCGGVEFQSFSNSTNIQLLKASSDMDIAMKVLEFLEKELMRRQELFRIEGVNTMGKYVEKTKKILPRLICMIDEFHALFGGTMKQATYADKILNEQIIRIGRKFGMHVILSTQSLGGNVRKSILDNIPLRIALGMTADQSSGFLGGRNEAAANLEKGVAIYNHKNGELSANKKVQINFLKDEEIENMIIKANLRNLNCEQFDKTII